MPEPGQAMQLSQAQVQLLETTIMGLRATAYLSGECFSLSTLLHVLVFTSVSLTLYAVHVHVQWCSCWIDRFAL
jgi:hypothetical protein